MIPRALRPVLATTAAVLGALVVAGCGGNATPQAKATETPVDTQTQVPVPDGVKLTAYGTELKFGEPATVAYAPNPQRKSVLQLTVASASQGKIADLSGFELDDRTRASTLYYVRVSVTNVGTGDVGRSPIPLFLVDDRNTLLQPSTFRTATFSKCPSLPLPTTFGPNASMSTCMVFLAPDHGRMSGVSFRPDQAEAPILWKGVVKVPAVVKKKKAS